MTISTDPPLPFPPDFLAICAGVVLLMLILLLVSFFVACKPSVADGLG